MLVPSMEGTRGKSQKNLCKGREAELAAWPQGPQRWAKTCGQCVATVLICVKKKKKKVKSDEK